MNITVLCYLLYTLASLALTIWVARTLHRNGRIFLVQAFRGSEAMADSVNHLLVVGFYLINFGYMSLALKLTEHVTTPTSAVEALSNKVGLVLVVLGTMHFFNLYVFSRIRRQRRIARAPRPVEPDGMLAKVMMPMAGMGDPGMSAASPAKE